MSCELKSNTRDFLKRGKNGLRFLMFFFLNLNFVGGFSCLKPKNGLNAKKLRNKAKYKNKQKERVDFSFFFFVGIALRYIKHYFTSEIFGDQRCLKKS